MKISFHAFKNTNSIMRRSETAIVYRKRIMMRHLCEWKKTTNGNWKSIYLYYTLHQRLTDTRCFIPHLEKSASALPKPKTVIADAGDGSEENYLFALGEKKEPLFDFVIPYGTYQKNTSGFEQNYKIYECEDCLDCPLKAKCTIERQCMKKWKQSQESPWM